MMALWCFHKIYFGSRSEGWKTRLLLTEETGVICFCPIVLLKIQCCCWYVWTNSGTQWQTLQRQQQMTCLWTDIVLKTSCEVCSRLSVASISPSHARARVKATWMQMGQHYQTWLISVAPTISRWPVTRVISSRLFSSSSCLLSVVDQIKVLPY